VPLCRSAVPREPLRRAASAPFEPREAPSLVGAAKRPRGGATITAAAANAYPDKHSTTEPPAHPPSPEGRPVPLCRSAVPREPLRRAASAPFEPREAPSLVGAAKRPRGGATITAAAASAYPDKHSTTEPPAHPPSPEGRPVPFAVAVPPSRVSRSGEQAPPPFEPREAPPLGGAAKRPPAWSDHHRCRCERLSRPTLDHPPTPRLRRAGPGRCGFPTVAAGRRIQPRKPRTGEPPP
jgi:hypothetical protein